MTKEEAEEAGSIGIEVAIDGQSGRGFAIIGLPAMLNVCTVAGRLPGRKGEGGFQARLAYRQGNEAFDLIQILFSKVSSLP